MLVFGTCDILCVLVTGDNFENGVIWGCKQKYILLSWIL